jgi:long-chain acyl-CoA synthetase
MEPATQIAELTEAVRALVRVGRILEHVSTELTLPQYRLLIMVASGDHRASQLAGRLALSRPTVTAVVDGLVERGMLARGEVTGDRRAVQLTLTGAGRAALLATDAAVGERLQCVLGHCDDPGLALAGLSQLAGALPRVVAEKLAEGGR